MVRSIRFTRAVVVVVVALLLGACSGGSSGVAGGGGELANVDLFGADGKPHFTFYYSCAGSVAQENELCSAPVEDFGDWARKYGAHLKRLPPDAFDEARGIPADKLVAGDAGQPYRVFVRFAPIAIGSYNWVLTSDVKGGYTPPRAGFSADIFVYATSDAHRVAQTHLVNRSDARQKGDPTPFVHDGAAAVLAAITPRSVAPNAAND